MKLPTKIFLAIIIFLLFISCETTNKNLSISDNSNQEECYNSENQTFLIFCSISIKDDQLYFLTKSRSKVNVHSLNVLIKCYEKSISVKDKPYKQFRARFNFLGAYSEKYWSLDLNEAINKKECQYFQIEVLDYYI